ncbi:MAG: tetratricopeptide repeat protein [Acidimicrobiales bacterium]|nr:tetratricopeptide repeat protein [Acidimicrobiales bacterium]MCB9373500.1 tetratricopeptide repeat protein [Microthrixaceae bacterium]
MTTSAPPSEAGTDPTSGDGPGRDDPGRPGADDPERRWPRGAALAVGCLVALVVGLLLAAARDADPSPDGAAADPDLTSDAPLPADHPSLDDSDQFESLTLSQLEAEVADESAPVALRLTLAERYLTTGDVEAARDQARIALRQSGTDVEQQRARRDLGWSQALLGRPERGAELLEQALELLPGERNATWYLANVRLSGLDDPAGAAELFQELLDGDELTDEQRLAVQERLDAAETLAG